MVAAVLDEKAQGLGESWLAQDLADLDEPAVGEEDLASLRVPAERAHVLEGHPVQKRVNLEALVGELDRRREELSLRL